MGNKIENKTESPDSFTTNYKEIKSEIGKMKGKELEIHRTRLILKAIKIDIQWITKRLNDLNDSMIILEQELEEEFFKE